MSDHSELKRLAEAFPADLDWDSNTEPFFNGPSGESLGGGATGFYSVYGKPFRLEGEDYDYDGPTYVEACTADFAKFMVAAREGVLALIAERDQLKAENEALCAKVANLSVSGFADAFYTVAEKLGITGARPVSPMQVFASEVLPALQSAIQDAERYRWIRDKSEAVHQFYLSVPLWFTGVRFRAQDVDKAIDAMSKGEPQ